MRVSIRQLRAGSARWEVRFYVRTKRQPRRFLTEDAARRYARDVAVLTGHCITSAQAESAFALIAGTDHSLVDVVKAGLEALHESEASMGPLATFADGGHALIDSAKRRGLRPATICTYEGCFKTTTKVFGARIACCISDADIEAFLDSVSDNWGRAGRGSVVSKHSYLRFIRSVLRKAGVARPVPSVCAPIPLDRDVKYFAIEEVKAILAAARSYERGAVALAIFLGVRPACVEVLPPNCVNVDEQTILIPAFLSKTHRSVLLSTAAGGVSGPHCPGPPPILWEWLRQFPYRPVNWPHLRIRLGGALDRRWVFDGCRHTAATYYRAKYGVFATAELLGHISPRLVVRHYAGIATKRNAERFFSITPDTVPPPPDTHPVPKIACCPEKLRQLVKVLPLHEIARMHGIQTAAVYKRCSELGFRTRSSPKQTR